MTLADDIRAIIAKHTKPRPATVEDGYGSIWMKCDRADCDLHVVRPGKVQCQCEEAAP